MKVIPAIDIMGGMVVRLVKGDAQNKVVYGSDPAEMAKKWEAAGADMLHVVDLDAAFGTGNNAGAIAKVVSAVKTPVQVAGGIRTPEAAKEALEKAARVVIGTMAYSDPEAVRKLAKKHPGRVVVSIDQAGGMIMVKGWSESAGVKVNDAISQFVSMGVEDFLLTSIERDGTLQGPDIETLANAVAFSDKARIIASGGISSLEDTIRVKSVGCAAVILGKAMYDGRVSIERVKAIA
ncbi:1-(5-phosphoribosyl)-5-[(5-phosphoribosylamino)methylideneamino]imidazole-4-carboxamide isomerase [Nitrososphaera viennensis]|uniref:1-(5-phosphoribosyl)-5-[(5-phosphoribosylamino)methylideneamino] imidazole-4-carboxamide isomerase n=2 Tax=Nitrososphaera viennensis TaxID=1034015 RepID=A0A060HU26_9ARCH|nr:1-(5-phosphoribosyl)-5-[(5-phosphoribosylamino)methylideneamino]imidazole-4-carboxamide isomerase [Nitrososphaera viennensis]AIC16612.1 1-(5-phosphoribosyl)-5-[(5- phosphoribosylamino)methylideneamino] imidazole-4-carboxamide isomerase [Nitrososphaera viennensis EN76]UVS68539.1 1-(5-phosphoribosyl)-5-[(5-phosphoribosylamino)methylideneamino]imidazole-4-carboxamide isomerase [Nitrososphaera viennensis]